MNSLEPIELMTVHEVLDRCRIGRTFLYQEIKQGHLRRLKIGRLTRFKVADVLAWLESRGTD